MNEEREHDELRPGTRPLAPGERRDEFDQQRGEVQHRGARALGTPPPSPPTPIGIAPPDPMNVVSNFDTRPIGAYDFAHTEHVNMGPGEVITFKDLSYQVPTGFTAVLRRVRIEWVPGAVMNLGFAAANAFSISLMRSEQIIPNNTVVLWGELNEYEWPTHHVYGFWETIGVRLNASGWAVPSNPNDEVTIAVTFMGVLIPTKGKPPAVEIASDPVLVRDYDKMRADPPKTGAAGS